MGIWDMGYEGGGMDGGKEGVGESFLRFQQQHRQARESKKIRIPSPLARSKRRPAGTGDVARRLACHAGDPITPER
jgi:hypothetical protein